jgi:hypothetical protein
VAVLMGAGSLVAAMCLAMVRLEKPQPVASA